MIGPHTAEAGGARTALSVSTVEMDGPAVGPLVEGLTEEYTRRYGADAAAREFAAHPAAEFSAPRGGVVLVSAQGRAVAGGAFRALDGAGVPTAEFKRIWTDAAHRRRGHGRAAMTALEDAAARRGYSRAYLTTGPAQPEAVAMYTRLGYTLVDGEGADGQGRRLYYAFTKELAEGDSSYDCP